MKTIRIEGTVFKAVPDAPGSSCAECAFHNKCVLGPTAEALSAAEDAAGVCCVRDGVHYEAA